jgi:hypothetical protein
MPNPPLVQPLSSTATIDDVCEAATRRSAGLSKETREVSDSLVEVLRFITKSEEIPAAFVPTLQPLPAMPEQVKALAAPEVKPRPELKLKAPAAVAPPSTAQNRSLSFVPAAFAAEEDPSGSLNLAPIAEPPEQPALGPNEVYFAPGQLLFNKGDGADNFFVIRKGNVALFEPTSQKEIAVLPAGVSFGEQAILVGGVRSVSARSVDGVICLALSAKTLRDMLEVQEGSIKPVIEALLLQLYLRNDLQARGHQFSA